MQLSEYAAQLSDSGSSTSLYLHDVPIFLLLPELLADVGPLPTGVLPPWYGSQWWRFAQFFMGPDGAVTPLHFDTLRTYNLFFHLRGRKRFTLIPWRDWAKCGRRGWRWFDLDPDAPDFTQVAAARDITYRQVMLEPGDILIMPPGMLHHVRSYGVSISFNIDFHTACSAVTSIVRSVGRAPAPNLVYSGASLAAQLGIAPRRAARAYAPYLNYIS